MVALFRRSPGRRFNAIQTLDEHLRADIGLAIHDPIPGSPSDEERAPRLDIAETLRTSARAFALPLAIPGTQLG